MYRDITTYDRRDAERKPSILENNVNGIRFRVGSQTYLLWRPMAFDM